MIKLTDILNEDCWKDYKQVGLKKKNGKMVPNCVPESVVKEEETITEIGIFPIRNYLKGIIPSKMWNTTTPQNKEKLKSTIDDLIRTLNQFWKQHNIPFRVREGKSQNEDLRKWFGKGKTGSTKGGNSTKGKTPTFSKTGA